MTRTNSEQQISDAVQDVADRIAELTRGRDAILRELRALRWLTRAHEIAAGDDGHVCLMGRRGSDEGRCFPTAVAAAAALGWPDTTTPPTSLGSPLRVDADGKSTEDASDAR
jgi:hypothetical protein